MTINYENWIIAIPGICVITDDEYTGSELILRKRIGSDMNYQQVAIQEISYPGEYELGGLTIQALSDSEGLLNYVINKEDEHIAYVQNSKLVTNRIFDNVSDWVCDRDDVVIAIEKLDDVGKIHRVG